MKKIVLLLTSVFINIGVFAQYQAGNIIASGTLILTSSQSKLSNGGTTVEGPKTTTFEIGPGVEYFFIGRWKSYAKQFN